MSNFKCQINTNGFTLIELLLAMSIAGILFGLTTIGLTNTQQSTSVVTSEEILIADLKSQQTKAMNGTDSSGSFGVHFSSNNTYTLFHGTSFTGASSTSVVSVDNNISFSGNDIVFSPVNGETNPTTITVASTVSSKQKAIELNRYGVVIKD